MPGNKQKTVPGVQHDWEATFPMGSTDVTHAVTRRPTVLDDDVAAICGVNGRGSGRYYCGSLDLS